ncbi:hypothetical protein LOK49_LG12G02361 [Camellia lanceoleosa]|uniref:Uncharacterized protein n=1 Tax=Camellia lanceoleosa TaxID=1840588 RepID=A0ACC0FXX5_9ERIC|nr:hypothetical protein LOK49_LG12G02361 [Camellia lanceoleosa]
MITFKLSEDHFNMNDRFSMQHQELNAALVSPPENGTSTSGSRADAHQQEGRERVSSISPLWQSKGTNPLLNSSPSSALKPRISVLLPKVPRLVRHIKSSSS